MSEKSNKQPKNTNILPFLSAQIDQTLDEDRRNTLVEIRKNLMEKSLTSDLPIENIPQNIIQKLQKYCQIIANENNIWKVNYTLSLFSNLIDVIYYKDFFESKNEIEKEMTSLIRRQLSSLPKDIVPSYTYDKNLEPITQNYVYDFQLPNLANRYYDKSVSQKERNEEWDLVKNLEMYVGIERERTAQLSDNLTKKATYLTQEFVESGDPIFQEKLVAEIQADIETMILYIGTDSASVNTNHNPYQNQKNHQIEKNLREQRKGRITAESPEYQATLENPEKVEFNQEWLAGARNREGRYQEIMNYRAKRSQKILEEMSKIKSQLEIYPPETTQHKKFLAEFLYWQECLMNLEKLANNEYGYYLWRKSHHEQFLKDKIRAIWQDRNDPKNSTKPEIRNLVKEIKKTQEYGYNWQDENPQRPKGL